MTAEIKKLPESKVEIRVELGKEELAGYVSRAETELAQNITIEGFRPGKAPKELIRNKVGEAKIREEALSLAIQSSLSEALRKESLDILEKVDFKIEENSPEKLVYKATFQLFPDLQLGDYKSLSIKKNSVVVASTEISAVLEDVAKSRVVLTEVERPARKGDRVEVDFNIKDEGKEIEGGKSENHPIVLGDGNFVPGFEDNILGMKTGEAKTFKLKIPPDYYQKAIAGKELDFEVNLKKVEDRVLPKMDDDFAKTLGNFKTMEEVKDSIRQGLTMEKEAKEKDRVRIAILKKIGESTKVEVPAVLIEKRTDVMIQDLDNELHQRGMELGLYLAQLKKTQDDLRKDWRPQAEEQVKMSLIARAIAKAESLKVEERDVDQEMRVILDQYVTRQPNSEEAVRNIDTGELKGKVHDMLLNEKVFDFLEKNTQFE